MFWCKKYSVCSECKVHFEPAPNHEAKWGHLCPTHRKPVIERDRRIAAVMEWAQANWEKLEPEALKAAAEAKENFSEYRMAMAIQQSMAAGHPHGGLFR